MRVQQIFFEMSSERLFHKGAKEANLFTSTGESIGSGVKVANY